jgi:hypothetical protein
MAKYRILVFAHLVKNNGVAKYGDIVDESLLNNNAEALVQQGFVELVEEPKKEESKKVEPKKAEPKKTEDKDNLM